MKFENLPKDQSTFAQVSFGESDLKRIADAQVVLEQHYNQVEDHSKIVARFEKTGTMCTYWTMKLGGEIFNMIVHDNGKINRAGEIIDD